MPKSRTAQALVMWRIPLSAELFSSTRGIGYSSAASDFIGDSNLDHGVIGDNSNGKVNDDFSSSIGGLGSSILQDTYPIGNGGASIGDEASSFMSVKGINDGKYTTGDNAATRSGTMIKSTIQDSGSASKKNLLGIQTSNSLGIQTSSNFLDYVDNSDSKPVALTRKSAAFYGGNGAHGIFDNGVGGLFEYNDEKPRSISDTGLGNSGTAVASRKPNRGRVETIKTPLAEDFGFSSPGSTRKGDLSNLFDASFSLVDSIFGSLLPGMGGMLSDFERDAADDRTGTTISTGLSNGEERSFSRTTMSSMSSGFSGGGYYSFSASSGGVGNGKTWSESKGSSWSSNGGRTKWSSSSSEEMKHTDADMAPAGPATISTTKDDKPDTISQRTSIVSPNALGATKITQSKDGTSFSSTSHAISHRGHNIIDAKKSSSFERIPSKAQQYASSNDVHIVGNNSLFGASQSLPSAEFPSPSMMRYVDGSFVQMKSVRQDTQVKSVRQDTQVKSVRQDTQVESVRQDTQVKSVRQDTQVESVRQDTDGGSQVRSVRQDIDEANTFMQVRPIRQDNPNSVYEDNAFLRPDPGLNPNVQDSSQDKSSLHPILQSARDSRPESSDLHGVALSGPLNRSANPGDPHSGLENPGDPQSGLENPGDLQIRLANSGDPESGLANSGDLESGLANSGDLESGLENPQMNSEPLSNLQANSDEFVNEERMVSFLQVNPGSIRSRYGEDEVSGRVIPSKLQTAGGMSVPLGMPSGMPPGSPAQSTLRTSDESVSSVNQHRYQHRYHPIRHHHYPTPISNLEKKQHSTTLDHYRGGRAYHQHDIKGDRRGAYHHQAGQRDTVRGIVQGSSVIEPSLHPVYHQSRTVMKEPQRGTSALGIVNVVDIALSYDRWYKHTDANGTKTEYDLLKPIEDDDPPTVKSKKEAFQREYQRIMEENEAREDEKRAKKEVEEAMKRERLERRSGKERGNKNAFALSKDKSKQGCLDVNFAIIAAVIIVLIIGFMGTGFYVNSASPDERRR